MYFKLLFKKKYPEILKFYLSFEIWQYILKYITKKQNCKVFL